MTMSPFARMVVAALQAGLAGQRLPDFGSRLPTPVSDEEREQHIHDMGLLMQECYARFEASGNPVDRDEAVMWMHMQAEAIRQRSPARVAAMESCYFTECGSRDAKMLEGARG